MMAPPNPAATVILRDGLPTHELSAVLEYSHMATKLYIHANVLPGEHKRVAAAMDRLLG